MKENSREEDIALIEKSLCDKDTIIQYHYWVGTDFLNAVERIVADYKRVLKENEELNNRCRNLDKEAQAYLEELAGDNTLTRRTIKQLQEENEECKLDVQDYLKQAQENAEMYRKAQKKTQDLKAENEELKEKNESLELEEKRRIIGRYGEIEIHKVINKVLVEDYIPVQKVKDKIEELQNNLHTVEHYETIGAIHALQELLESEERK